MRHLNKFLIISVLTALSLFPVQNVKANAIDTLLPWPSTFEQRKEQFIQDVMNNVYGETLPSGLEPCQRNLLWGYLEDKNPASQRQKDIIHLTLRAMVLGWRGIYGQEPELMHECKCNGLAGYDDGGVYQGYPDKTVGFGYSIWMDNALVPKVLIQYKNLVGTKISQADYDWLKSEVQKSIDNSSIFIAVNGNQQINVVTGVYLYAKNFTPNATFFYPDPCKGAEDEPACRKDIRWEEFTYNGHTYNYENTYNLLQFSRDWLEHTLAKFVNTKNYSDKYTRMAYYFEFDGNYQHAYLSALRELADLADEPLIKAKAQMVFDLMLLDFFMDFNGVLSGSHGGVEGRSGADDAYGYILFGFQKGMHSVYPEHNIYTTDYRIPKVVEDVIVLMDESSDYWHINLEYNPQLHSWETGKYTYVTKDEAVDGAQTTGVWEKLQSVYPEVNYPFNRIETVDYQGNKIINWQSNVMTVTKRGQSCIYDFNQWTYQCDDSPPPPSKGDLNDDGKVDVIDLGILLSNWGSTSKPPADINQDGKVDVIDLGILLSNWG